MTKKQVIVNWYTPEEKLPEECTIVIASISGKCRNIEWDHAFAFAEYYEDEGWYVDEIDLSLKDSWLKVHAWCDLEPFKGGQT